MPRKPSLNYELLALSVLGCAFCGVVVWLGYGITSWIMQNRQRDTTTVEGLELFYEYGAFNYVPSLPAASQRGRQMPRVATIGNDVRAAQLDALEALTSVTTVTLFNATITDRVIDGLAKCRHLRQLKLLHCTTADSVLERIEELWWLEAVTIVPPNRPNRQRIDLDILDGLGNLRWLYIESWILDTSELTQMPNPQDLVKLSLRCSVCTGGLSFLPEFRSLESLNLSYTNIGSEDLVALTHATSLEELDLSLCDIADDDVDALGQLRHLKLLHVNDTKLTAEGANRLAALLPHCQVVCGTMLGQNSGLWIPDTTKE